jgi:hypothetical protein
MMQVGMDAWLAAETPANNLEFRSQSPGKRFAAVIPEYAAALKAP